MADPFEVRLRFSSQLQHLNASVASAQKCAVYALKYKDLDEDLHSCIIEQLERLSMNCRANIMYFIEHFLTLAKQEGHPEFIEFMQRDMQRVIDAVAPADKSGTANVKVARKVLQNLSEKSILSSTLFSTLQSTLNEREVTSAHPDPSTFNGGGLASDASGTPRSRRPHRPANFDPKQIEQRILQDRERHKKLRESIWAVDSEGAKEFERVWDEVSEINEDDFRAAEEDKELREHTITFR